jgi:SAM-dependent methyltransferase
MKNDPWLKKWLDLIKQRSLDGSVLELGCGSGWDTLELLSAGCKVIAVDSSTENLAECAKSVPQAYLVQLDISRSFPFVDHSIPAIVASLSLHYFSWNITMQIESELRRCLEGNGVLIARFNSTHDYNYGASSTDRIEPNFYRVGTGTKRFFDENSVGTFFRVWNVQFLEENIIYRYEKPKSVWEVMAVPH